MCGQADADLELVILGVAGAVICVGLVNLDELRVHLKRANGKSDLGVKGFPASDSLLLC